MLAVLLLALFAAGCSSSPTGPTTAPPIAPARASRGLPLVITGQSNALNLWYYAFYVPSFKGVNIYPAGFSCDACLASTAIAKWGPGTDLWSKLEAELHKPLTAVVISEGEEDGLRGNPNFAADLKDWIARIRIASGNPTLLVVIMQTLPYPSYESIRQAQGQVAAADPNVLLVNVDDVPKLDESHPSVEEGYPMAAQRILAAIATRY